MVCGCSLACATLYRKRGLPVLHFLCKNCLLVIIKYLRVTFFIIFEVRLFLCYCSYSCCLFTLLAVLLVHTHHRYTLVTLLLRLFVLLSKSCKLLAVAKSLLLLRLWSEVQLFAVTNRLLMPVKTDMPPAPKDLLRIFRCNCKTGCESRRCTCGLQCTPACGKCKGLSSSNSPKPFSKSDLDNLEDINDI